MSDNSFPLILKTLVIVGKKVVDNEREKYNPITHRVSTLKIKKGSSAMLPN